MAATCSALCTNDLPIPMGPPMVLRPKPPTTLWHHEIRVEFQFFTDGDFGQEYHCWLTCDEVARAHDASLVQVPLEIIRKMAQRRIMQELIQEGADVNFAKEHFWKKETWAVDLEKADDWFDLATHRNASLNADDVVIFHECPSTPKRKAKRRRCEGSPSPPSEKARRVSVF